MRYFLIGVVFRQPNGLDNFGSIMIEQDHYPTLDEIRKNTEIYISIWQIITIMGISEIPTKDDYDNIKAKK